MHREEWDLPGLTAELSVMLMRPVSESDLSTDRYEPLLEKAQAVGEAAYRARESEFGPELMRELERHLYLFTLDEHWRDHLYELDHLKGCGPTASGTPCSSTRRRRSRCSRRW